MKKDIIVAIAALLPGMLTVQSLQGAAPTINARQEGTNVVINFSGRLQSSSHSEGPYTNVAGASSPRLTPVSDAPQQFWRSVLGDVRSIATSGRHTLAIRNDGTLWAWGDNQSGQLGIGTFSTGVPLGAYEPVQIGTDTDWQTVVAGFAHSFAIKRNGTLWAWGDNWSGQLGIGPIDHVDFKVTFPTQVGTNTNWRFVATGGPTHFLKAIECYTLAVRNDGTLWGWGENRHAQLGNGTTESSDRPIQIGAETNWETVVAGDSHTAAMRTDGTLWAWGNNASGQLGIGTVTTNSPFGADQPAQVGTNADWQTLTASETHTLAIRSDHTLWAWGFYGQLAIAPSGGTNRPSRLDIGSNWQAAATADKWTMALRTDGTLWSWGYNFSGQLGAVTSLHLGPSEGVGFRAETNHPVQVGTNATWLAVAVGGPMSHFGSGHTVALQKDGTVWTWGGDGLELGNGTGAIVNEPVRVGSNTNWKSVFAGALCSFGLLTDGTLWAWGENNRGQLGIGRIVDVNYPVQVGTNVNWQAAAAGSLHTVALRADGTLWACGQALGINSITNDAGQFAQVSPGSTWRAVAAGGDWYGTGLTAAIRSDGTLWTWSLDTQTPVQMGTDSNWRTVAAGSDHGVAVRNDGTLWEWGRDGPGGLGTGIPNFTTNYPVQVGTNVNWQTVAANVYHTLVLRTDGTLWAWGDNYWGQLGNGDDQGAQTNRPTQVGTDANWRVIAAGVSHSLAIRADGTLWAWGGNVYGQLGLGLPTGFGGGGATNRPVQVGTNTNWQSVAAGEHHSLAVCTDGTLWAWGDRSFGQTAQPVPWLPHPVPGTNWLVP